ncbi:hypothetical protein AB4Z48_06730 [Cupriavidus sp. 2TAF22]|uniref:hypothetical protein n=1 Tax=unclassified Cupriavidus TaxID=2640874 RepID=UPI003F92C90E
MEIRYTDGATYAKYAAQAMRQEKAAMEKPGLGKQGERRRACAVRSRLPPSAFDA